MTTELPKRVTYSLLLCRIITALTFAAWGYGMIVRPAINSVQLGKYYYIGGLPNSAIMGLGAIQIAISIAVLVGFQKKITTGILLLLAILTTFLPKFAAGYYIGTIGGEAHPVILFFAFFCLLGTAAMTFIMRDEDTLWSIGSSEGSTASSDTSYLSKIGLPLFLCRFGVFFVFLAWTWDKLFNARHAAGIFQRFYKMTFVTEGMVLAVGLAELALLLVVLLGFYKRISRGLMIIFSSVTTFSILTGVMKFFEPGNSNLDRRSGEFVEFFLLPTFAMLVCAIVIYALRKEDTKFSFSKEDRALNA